MTFINNNNNNGVSDLSRDVTVVDHLWCI